MIFCDGVYCNLTGFQSSHYHSGPTRKFACSLYEILPDNCTNPCGLIIRTVPALFLNLHELRFSNSHLYTFSRLQILQTCSCRCRLAGTVPVAPLSVWWRWTRVRYELSRVVGLLRPFFGITAPSTRASTPHTGAAATPVAVVRQQVCTTCVSPAQLIATWSFRCPVHTDHINVQC